MSRDEIREFFFKEGLIHFDETPCQSYDLKRDLSPEIWARFVSRAGIPANMDMKIALRNLHLVKDDRMTHAGAWLLCNDITRYTLRAGVTCALFRGTTNVHILDRRDFTGDLYSIYEDCMAYVESRLNTALIPHARGRDERLELPEDALREALVNAIAHRDYRSTANVQVHIYLDRLEIITPGGLPAGMKEEELGHKSVPRNPLLFGLFYRMNLVEQIGSGIKRIRDLCREYGVADPKFEIPENWVTVSFPRVMEGKKSLPGEQVSGEVAGEVTGEVAGEVMQLLEILPQPKTRAEMQNTLNLKGQANFRDRYLQPALDNGLVEMTIPDKPRSSKQKYRLTVKGKELLEKLGESD